MTEPQLLTVKDVQRITKLGRTKVYELIRRGELPVIRIGRAVRIPRAALEAWLEAMVEEEYGVQRGSGW